MFRKEAKRPRCTSHGCNQMLFDATQPQVASDQLDERQSQSPAAHAHASVKSRTWAPGAPAIQVREQGDIPGHHSIVWAGLTGRKWVGWDLFMRSLRPPTTQSCRSVENHRGRFFCNVRSSATVRSKHTQNQEQAGASCSLNLASLCAVSRKVRACGA